MTREIKAMTGKVFITAKTHAGHSLKSKEICSRRGARKVILFIVDDTDNG